MKKPLLYSIYCFVIIAGLCFCLVFVGLQKQSKAEPVVSNIEKTSFSDSGDDTSFDFSDSGKQSTGHDQENETDLGNDSNNFDSSYNDDLSDDSVSGEYPSSKDQVDVKIKLKYSSVILPVNQNVEIDKDIAEVYPLSYSACLKLSLVSDEINSTQIIFKDMTIFSNSVGKAKLFFNIVENGAVLKSEIFEITFVEENDLGLFLSRTKYVVGDVVSVDKFLNFPTSCSAKFKKATNQIVGEDGEYITFETVKEKSKIEMSIYHNGMTFVYKTEVQVAESIIYDLILSKTEVDFDFSDNSENVLILTYNITNNLGTSCNQRLYANIISGSDVVDDIDLSRDSKIRITIKSKGTVKISFCCESDKTVTQTLTINVK